MLRVKDPMGDMLEVVSADAGLHEVLIKMNRGRVSARAGR